MDRHLENNRKIINKNELIRGQVIKKRQGNRATEGGRTSGNFWRK
jgi:hypothetical protein